MKTRLVFLGIICFVLVSFLVPVINAEGSERQLSVDNESHSYSGTSGECSWIFDGTVLTVSGNGRMADYSLNSSVSSAPWANRVKQLVIHEGVTGIGSYAFYSCPIYSVTLPESMVSIGAYAFAGTQLSTVTIPASVSYVGDSAFSGCEWLTRIQVADENQHFTVEDNVLYRDNNSVLVCYPPKRTGTSFTVPETVHTIGGGAFSCCYSLSTIQLPQGVASIGDHAFELCSNLKEMVLPEGLIQLGNGVFYRCRLLSTVAFPETVVSIGVRTFYECSSLHTLVFPDELTSIDAYAFYGCSGLYKVYYEGSQEAFSLISGVNGSNTDLKEATWLYNACMKNTIDHTHFKNEAYCCSHCGKALYVIGDLNEDGKASSDDAIYLLYHTLLGGERYPKNQPIDFNGDTDVNSDDAIYLLYHTLLGAERYPLY